ncbi:hypothetical protein [Vibrio owensii]|uniref:Uncharacterized protein n=1 Tax=Vibrio owensii CAIM 1854 = LMG 25443 TaxID=1229493 RepID=A0A0C1WAX9_9VIBR|nr:hypothetical protein [Vibrio owensii]KIF53452.1 hypothetical protein H735_11110 [Vibrio owensii CAIM 1854 = LMG 25443]
MKFFATNLIENEIVKLTLNETESIWFNEKHGFEFPRNTWAQNYLPVKLNLESCLVECIEGYFEIEVTDPNGKKGVFTLNASDNTVSCGAGQLYPGVNCDDKIEGEKLAKAGLKRPGMGFDFCAHMAWYAFNEGEAKNGSFELEPDVEVAVGDYYPEEETYLWKIL